MYKKIIVIMLCILMILTSCNKQNEANSTVDNKISNNNDTFQNFELIALKADNQGIELSSAFQLSSNKKIDKSFIKDNLQIIPEIDYELKKVSSTIYNVIPSSGLENNKIYQIKLNNASSPYSWAFQTKKQFSVENTIPYDKSSYVPINSGIELYFNMGNLESIDEYFSIIPYVEGKFLYNDKNVVFVSKNGLTDGKRYTVTIKKGFGVKDSSEKLLEDFVFSFDVNSNNSEIPFHGEDLINIYDSNSKVFKGYFGNEYTNSEFKIDIYKFNNADSFSNSFKEYYKSKEINENPDSSSILKRVNTIYQKPYMQPTSYANEGIFELPNELNKGYYLLNISLEGKDFNCYEFLQINDMMMYNAVFYDKILLYAVDGKNSQGINNAEVFINDKKIGKTGKDGIIVSEINAEELKENLNIIRVKAKNYSDFIYVENLYSNRYYYDSLYSNMFKYNTYMYTDRSVYMPTDTINIWGYARLKDGSKVDKVKLELVETNTDIVIDTKYVDLTDVGTYQTEFSLNYYTGDYCKINVYHNNKIIYTDYKDIKEYTKPLYSITSKFDKEFVYSKEPLKLKLNAKFFDGYPASNIEIRYGNDYNIYYGGSSEYKVAILDNDGEVSLDIDTYTDSTNWRPQNAVIYSSNNTAEETTISNYNNYTVFPKRQMLEIEGNYDGSGSFNVLLHELDNSLYGTDKYVDFKSLRGKPIDGNVKITIFEYYYDKYKESEYYDFINKVNVTNYRYVSKENIVYDNVITTSDGLSNITIPNYNSERDYRIIVSYDDGDGGITEESYFRGTFYPYSRNYYYLNKTVDKEKYRLNEEIELSLKFKDNDVDNKEDDKLLVLVTGNGLIEYKLLDDTTFKYNFKESFIPNVIFNGVYIKNGYMYPVDGWLSLNYDYSERQIYFDVTTDKQEYRPGEEVTLDIKAYDENKNPIEADVNISVVDEAYFAVFPQDVDILRNIYGYYYSTGLLSTYLSNREITFDDGAEKGGGGGGNDGILREKFKDTSVFKTVRTGKNGMANLKFKLADNITSWRITYQGISDKKYAGNGTKNITASLPFYVDMIMYNKYLKEDNISVSLRVFGKDTQKGEKVDYKVVVKNKADSKEQQYKKEGIIGEYTNIYIGNKDIGQYEIYVYASSNNLKDAIKEEFEVVESYVYFNNATKYKVADNTVLDEIYSNHVITLYNNSQSDFFLSLRDIAGNNGKRIDQIVCSMAATNYINNYFDLDLYYNEKELVSVLNGYVGNYGGYTLLPYTADDTELTAKVAYVVDNKIINYQVKKYFDNVLSDTVYSNRMASALWGLAKNKEPILLNIYELLKNQELPIRDKLYLYLALAELGDINTVEKYYKQTLDSYVKKSGEYLYFENNFDDIDNYELTSLMAILGVKLKDYENSDLLFKFIYNNPSNYTLSNLEQLIYIMNRDILSIDEVKDLFGEVTVTINDKKYDYKLKLFDTVSFSVEKDDIKNVKFSNIKGDIECVVEALGNKDDLAKNKSDEFKIGINYSSENSTMQKTNFKQSEIIKVTITPSVIDSIMHGSYEITYVLPSGFRFVKSDKNNHAWLIEEGQKLRYFISFHRQNFNLTPVMFYMQATQSGEYTVDYAVIKEDYSTKLNYIEKSKIKIE